LADLIDLGEQGTSTELIDLFGPPSTQ